MKFKFSILFLVIVLLFTCTGATFLFYYKPKNKLIQDYITIQIEGIKKQKIEGIIINSNYEVKPIISLLNLGAVIENFAFSTNDGTLSSKIIFDKIKFSKSIIGDHANIQIDGPINIKASMNLTSTGSSDEVNFTIDSDPSFDFNIDKNINNLISGLSTIFTEQKLDELLDHVQYLKVNVKKFKMIDSNSDIIIDKKFHNWIEYRNIIVDKFKKYNVTFDINTNSVSKNNNNAIIDSIPYGFLLDIGLKGNLKIEENDSLLKINGGIVLNKANLTIDIGTTRFAGNGRGASILILDQSLELLSLESFEKFKTIFNPNQMAFGGSLIGVTINSKKLMDEFLNSVFDKKKSEKIMNHLKELSIISAPFENSESNDVMYITYPGQGTIDGHPESYNKNYPAIPETLYKLIKDIMW